MAGELLLDRPADGVLRLTISNPAKRNALDHAILDAIAVALGELGDARALLLTGADGMFSSGYDIGGIPDDVFAEEAERLVAHPFAAALEALEGCELPTIAGLPGHTIGGGLELALACDLRVADTTATFGLPEVAIGIVPSSGGTHRLVRMLGTARAKELVLLRDRVDVEEAHRLGLVTETAPEGEALDRSLALAERLGELPPLAVAVAKEAIDAMAESSRAAGLGLERLAYGMLAQTEDAREAAAAFSEKRPPRFRGR
jgi:enoyl-CoA hydratase/carnithine racemase